MQKEIRFAIERTTSTGCQSHASAGAARALLRVRVGRRVLLREAADQSSGAGRHSSSDYGNSPGQRFYFPFQLQPSASARAFPATKRLPPGLPFSQFPLRRTSRSTSSTNLGSMEGSAESRMAPREAVSRAYRTLPLSRFTAQTSNDRVLPRRGGGTGFRHAGCRIRQVRFQPAGVLRVVLTVAFTFQATVFQQLFRLRLPFDIKFDLP